MNIEEAREIICSWKNPGPENRHSPLYREAQGFVSGWNAAVKKCAQICRDSVKEEVTGDGLGRWLVCSKTPLQLEAEILKLATQDSTEKISGSQTANNNSGNANEPTDEWRG